MQPFTLNIRGQLHSFERPAVMGIVNVTPDSFYHGSRTFDDGAIAAAVAKMVTEGADILDVGAYSSRPGAGEVPPEEEAARLERGLKMVRAIAPEIPVSVDTFRAEIARKAITEWGADIINDISGGNLDENMFDTVSELQAPYILMHMRGKPSDMQEYANYENVTADVLAELGDRLRQLALIGVNDIIIDPGFGFSKTTEQNYHLLRDLNTFKLFHRPILVGVSRKSMVTKVLGITADDALNGTTVINTLALDRGASILRVHDVKAAVQAVLLHEKMTNGSSPNS